MTTLNKPKKIAMGTPLNSVTIVFFFREDGSWLGNFYNKGVSYRPITELRQEWELE